MKNRFFILLSVLSSAVLISLLISCPTGRDPDEDNEPKISEITVDDDGENIRFRVVAINLVTCCEVTDTTPYDTDDVLTPLFEISGTLNPGEEATISFRREDGFSDQASIAYYDSGWQIVTSATDSLQGMISARVDHFSTWAVVTIPPVEISISGTVTIDMGAAWTTGYWATLNSKELSVILLDSVTNEPIEGKTAEAAREEWTVGEDQVYTFPYQIDEVSVGSYLVGAVIDIDGDGQGDGDEPLMLYGGADPEEIIVATEEDLTDIDMTIATVQLNGTVTLSSGLTSEYGGEDIYLILMSQDEEFDDPFPSRFTLENPVLIGSGNDSTNSFPCDFSISGIPTSYNIITAYVDMDGNGDFDEEDGEPFGIWTENVDGDDIYPYLFADDQSDVDLTIDTVMVEPEVEILSPLHLSTQEDLIFDVNGTAEDDEDLTGEAIDLYVYHSSDVSEYELPPVVTGSPLIQRTATIDGSGNWSCEGLDLSSHGTGSYSVIALYTDSTDMMGGDYAIITIEINYDTEGAPNAPYELALGTAHAGEVDTTYSYYEASVTMGERYLITMEDITDNVYIQLFADYGYTYPADFLENGYSLDTTTKMISREAESTKLFIRVSGYYCTDGANYSILVEHLTDTFTLNGTVLIGDAFPAGDYPLIIQLSEGWEGKILELSEATTEGDSSLSFSLAGVLSGYYEIFAFLDENENGEFDYQSFPPEYSAMSELGWCTENRTGLSLELIREEF